MEADQWLRGKQTKISHCIPLWRFCKDGVSRRKKSDVLVWSLYTLFLNLICETVETALQGKLFQVLMIDYLGKFCSETYSVFGHDCVASLNKTFAGCSYTAPMGLNG